jgi:hypothetical protein
LTKACNLSNSMNRFKDDHLVTSDENRNGGSKAPKPCNNDDNMQENQLALRYCIGVKLGMAGRGNTCSDIFILVALTVCMG